MSGEGGQDQGGGPGEASNEPSDSTLEASPDRQDRNASFREEAPRDELLDPDMTGEQVDPDVAGFNQPTALFDKGEFLGELAELSQQPGTRAKVDAEAAAPRGCRLIVVDGPDLGMEWSFKVPKVVVGRDEDCELVMSDIAVSRRHAQITLEGERFVLTDLGSGNGTFLNGLRIESQELSPGDEVSIGERTLRFVELSQAPPTAAAHPVSAGPLVEPIVGTVDPAAVPGEEGLESGGPFEPLGLPAGDGGGVSSEAPTPGAESPGGLPRGMALKQMAAGVGALILVVGLLGVVGWVFQRYFVGESPAERRARAQREFLVGVELVKLKRCGDAQILFRRVLEIRPKYARAREYIAHCDREIAQWNVLEGVRQLVRNGRHLEGIERLGAVSPDSAYADDAQRLKAELAEGLGRERVREAEGKWRNGDVFGARELVSLALEGAPGLSAAQELQTRIEAAAAAASVRPARPASAKPSRAPPRFERALRFYARGQIGAAIDAAEVAGGSRSAEYVERLKRVRTLLRKTSEAHRAKDARGLLRVAPAALEADHVLLRGKGSVRTELRRYQADGFYLRGVEALQRENQVEAFRDFSRALQVDPEHRLARDRLTDLRKKVEDIYYEAYILKDSDPEQTRKVFRRIVKMTAPSDRFHRLATRWLQQNGG